MAFRTSLLATLMISTLGLAPARGAGSAKIDWLTSLDKAQAKAKKENKILLVDFYATWCGPCKMMDRQTFTDARVIKLARESFIFVKIDTDRDRELSAKYQISSLPTFIFFGPNGGLLQRAPGFIVPARFVPMMNDVLTESREVAKLVEKIKANPDDDETALNLLPIYIRRQQFDEAFKLLAVVERAEKSGGSVSEAEAVKRKQLMPIAYTAIAEGSLNEEKHERALVLARKALTRASEPELIARVRAIIINSFLGQEKKAEAIKELEALIAWKDVPGPLRGRAQGLVAELSKQLASAKKP